jgi:DNA primase
MSGENYDFAVRFLIEQFKHAAIVTHFGYEDEDRAMQRAGIGAAKRVAQGLDAFDARLALAPLLEDPDWGVRASAAGYLVKAVPERALAVLKEIRDHCPTHARMTASEWLKKYERGELEA